MKPLPICFFTHKRTKLARYVIRSLKDNLSADGYVPAFILCHDGSCKEHVDALRDEAGDWLYAVTDSERRGLGASMNLGIEKALSISDVFLRMEDDWILQRPLEVGPWADFMKKDSVGVIRMGMMFRDHDELEPYGPKELGLLRMRPHPNRTYNVNNQVALIHEQVHHLCGKYRENCTAQASERDFADKFNMVTSNCVASPWVCWPKGWATKTYDAKSLGFVHAGKSTLGHSQYSVPERYKWLNR